MRWHENEVCSVSAFRTRKKAVIIKIDIKYHSCLPMKSHKAHSYHFGIFTVGNLHLLHWPGTEKTEENSDTIDKQLSRCRFPSLPVCEPICFWGHHICFV